MKKRTIASIDVGTTKVCTIIGEQNEENQIRIIGVGITPSRGLHKGMVVNIDEAGESVKESIRKAEQASGYRIDSAYVGVTGRHVSCLNNKGAIAITRGDRMVKPDDLRRVLQTAQSYKVPNDRKLLHVIPRSYALDGQVGVKNPVGMHGTRLDVETHVITAAVASVQNLVKCIRSIGLDIDDLVLEPLASAEAVLTEEEKQSGIIIADIGGGTTDICVFREGSIWHTSVVPVAGYQFTRDISIGLGIPFEVAEEMKKRYGTLVPAFDTKSRTNAISSQDGQGVSHQDICDILKARTEELLRLILLELPRSDYRELVPGGLVLTGGSSSLAGLASLAQEQLQMPVRIGAPSRIDGIGDSLCNPAYATGVGLLLWGAKVTGNGSRTWQSSGSGLGGQIKRIFSKFFGAFR